MFLFHTRVVLILNLKKKSDILLFFIFFSDKLGSLSGCAKSGKRDKPKRSNKAGKVRSGAVSGKTR